MSHHDYCPLFAPFFWRGQCPWCRERGGAFSRGDLVGQETVADFPLGVLSRDLRVQAGQELPPCGEMPAVVVRADGVNGYVKTMSWYELEKL